MYTLARCSKKTWLSLMIACAVSSPAFTEESCKTCEGGAAFAVPLGLPPIEWPADNPYSAVKAALGRFLFFDPRLSSDGSVSCASCHSPHAAFGDGARVSTGIRAQEGSRNAPTVINSAYNTTQFWDGRAETLEAQALGPLINPIEMGNPDHHAVVDRLKQITGYRDLMRLAFNTDDFTIAEVAKAIATFERTVLSGNSAFDRYQMGDKKALTEQQVRGMDLFFGKANCSRCHGGPLFTDGRFRNIGIGTDQSVQDAGRADITADARDCLYARWESQHTGRGCGAIC
jgi:cytochrome c peroxidase